jgi:formylglycine-generating enzyme required for sulfatase activity
MKQCGGVIVAVILSARGEIQAETPEFTACSTDGIVSWSYPTNGVGEYRLVMATGLVGAAWVALPYGVMPSGTVVTGRVPVEMAVQFFRVSVVTWDVSTNPVPGGMVLIPGGAFGMGDNLDEGSINEYPARAVNVAPLYVDSREVSLALWQEIYQWATNDARGYDFDGTANGRTNDPAQPVQSVSWYDCVKWCNARSEKEGRVPAYYTSADQSTLTVYRSGVCDVKNDWVRWAGGGYRLPTEAEWEKAARGGSSGRFPWGDTITHSNANYNSESYEYYTYDESETRGLHPLYTDWTGDLCTSPVGAFPANAYGIFDAVGNVWEWCWDRYGDNYYAVSPDSSSLGPEAGEERVYRGGSWYDNAYYGRLSYRGAGTPSLSFPTVGFRCVLTALE